MRVSDARRRVSRIGLIRVDMVWNSMVCVGVGVGVGLILFRFDSFLLFCGWSVIGHSQSLQFRRETRSAHGTGREKSSTQTPETKKDSKGASKRIVTHGV